MMDTRWKLPDQNSQMYKQGGAAAESNSGGIHNSLLSQQTVAAARKGSGEEKKTNNNNSTTQKLQASNKQDPLTHAWASAGARASRTYTLRLAGPAQGCAGAPGGSYGK